MGKYQEQRCCQADSGKCSTGSPWEGGASQMSLWGIRMGRYSSHPRQSPRKGTRPQRRNRCIVGPHRRSFKRLAKFPCPSEIWKHVSLCPRGQWRNGGCSWTLGGHANKVKHGSINYQYGRVPWRTRFLTLSLLLLLLLHTLAAYNHLPETRHDPKEREG